MCSPMTWCITQDHGSREHGFRSLDVKLRRPESNMYNSSALLYLHCRACVGFCSQSSAVKHPLTAILFHLRSFSELSALPVMERPDEFEVGEMLPLGVVAFDEMQSKVTSSW